MRHMLSVCVIVCVAARCPAANPVLELTVGDQSLVGRPVAHNDGVCWLAHPDGQLSEVSLTAVSAFRKVGDAFESLTSLEARNQLRKELGREWEIIGTGHYLVCARTGRGQAYADHFESLYRSFRSYFQRRGFNLPEPEFPLIAIVYASQRDFAAQCQADGIPFVRGLRGYYHRRTNRISLFEEGEDFVELDGGFAAEGVIDANIQASLKDTIVHEATHQVAYNLGLHSRISQPPRWIVEGLATMFEADGTRTNTGGKHPRGRVNDERLWWFNLYRAERRDPGSLPQFVSEESLFLNAPLDYYAQAWALTFFLAETRPMAYAGYLKQVADRNPLERYTPQQRLQDFQTAFGSDLSRLEVDMLRFIDDLH